MELSSVDAASTTLPVPQHILFQVQQRHARQDCSCYALVKTKPLQSCRMRNAKRSCILHMSRKQRMRDMVRAASFCIYMAIDTIRMPAQLQVSTAGVMACICRAACAPSTAVCRFLITLSKIRGYLPCLPMTCLCVGLLVDLNNDQSKASQSKHIKAHSSSR